MSGRWGAAAPVACAWKSVHQSSSPPTRHRPMRGRPKAPNRRRHGPWKKTTRDARPPTPSRQTHAQRHLVQKQLEGVARQPRPEARRPPPPERDRRRELDAAGEAQGGAPLQGDVAAKGKPRGGPVGRDAL
eukprot:TRINITY_DN8654_c0_g1_i1.p2 TRINITY_DN8654_c0_g1~~TRINITY_DN8654_c0_g1_i1.p2  ORF type:complete len:131 (+),score=5.72 TRINITY_DN8654_c0_g1_i1:67-459(+)